MNFWDFIWLILWGFYFAAYLYVVVLIVADLFRDRTLNGWLKALWIIFLVFVPFLTALVYLIARGSGMAARSGRARSITAEDDGYAPRASADPTGDIEKAKALQDAGVITQGEFEALKSKALSNRYFGS